MFLATSTESSVTLSAQTNFKQCFDRCIWVLGYACIYTSFCGLFSGWHFCVVKEDLFSSVFCFATVEILKKSQPKYGRKTRSCSFPPKLLSKYFQKISSLLSSFKRLSRVCTVLSSLSFFFFSLFRRSKEALLVDWDSATDGS